MNNSLWLWRWPWHRLSKCQSLSTTLLFWMIIFHLLNLKILIKICPPHPTPTFFKILILKFLIVICLLTKHWGVLMNLFKHVRVLQVFGSVGFWGEGKTEIPGEPRTNSTHIWHWRWNLNPDHIGGRRVLSPLCHPCSPNVFSWSLGFPWKRFPPKWNLLNAH